MFRVLELECRHPVRDRRANFFVLDAPDWVNVVAVTTDRRFVLVTQFRFGTQDFSLEIPGGVIDRGEDPIAAARRELLEETGFGGGEARLLARIHPNPAIQNNHCHLVLIDGVTRTSETSWDEHEEIHPAVLPGDEVYALARRGEITHALTIDALFFFEPEWRRRQGVV